MRFREAEAWPRGSVDGGRRWEEGRSEDQQSEVWRQLRVWKFRPLARLSFPKELSPSCVPTAQVARSRLGQVGGPAGSGV